MGEGLVFFGQEYGGGLAIAEFVDDGVRNQPDLGSVIEAVGTKNARSIL